MGQLKLIRTKHKVQVPKYDLGLHNRYCEMEIFKHLVKKIMSDIDTCPLNGNIVPFRDHPEL